MHSAKTQEAQSNRAQNRRKVNPVNLVSSPRSGLAVVMP